MLELYGEVPYAYDHIEQTGDPSFNLRLYEIFQISR